jgi:starch synthase
MSELKLCMLSSEIFPFAKTGGLADVVGALFTELAQRGVEVSAFMPLYASVRAGELERQPVAAVQRVAIPIGDAVYEFSLLSAPYPGTERHVYFIDCPTLFDRTDLYTTDADEHRRFLLFTLAALESCERLGLGPQVIHCNDWHTAFVPLLLKTRYAGTATAAARTVLTIHNIAYQGIMPGSAVADLQLGANYTLLDQTDLRAGFINSLKTGIKFADVVTTVSPTYAREICDTPLGMGMQAELRARTGGVIGILNGVDYREWDPRHDPHLKDHFGPTDLSGKQANKRSLLREGAFDMPATAPLLAVVSRLTEQKGFDLMYDVLPDLLGRRECGFIALGSGERRYVEFFERLVEQFPGRAWFRSGYDETLAHRIEAGSDLFLMPSRYEPCGLNQMYSLRYGTIPVVHRTGGLADSVRHFDPASGQGTGCVFNDFDVTGLSWALATALDWYGEPKLWQRLVQNAMAQDFSWSHQVGQYEELFRRLSA